MFIAGSILRFRRFVYRKSSIMLLWVLVFQAFFVVSIIPTALGGIYWNYKTDGGVNSVGVSADGKYIVAGTSNGTVFLFASNGSLLWSHHFAVDVECVAISGDGSRIVVGIEEYRSGSPDIYLFDNFGNIIWQKDLVKGSWPCDVAISPDAQYIVTGDTYNVFYFYDIYGRQIWNYTAGSWVTAVSVSSGGEYAAAGSWDDNLYFFNKAGSLLWSKPFEYSVDAVSISPEGQYVAAGCGANMSLFANNGSLLSKTSFYIGVDAVSLSSNADRIAVAAYENVTIIDKAANVICERETTSTIEDIAITADGKYVAFGCGNYVYFFEVLPPSEITCEVSPSIIFLGRSVTINGSIQPQLSGEQVKLEYKLTVQDSTYNEDGFVNVTRTVTTSANGSFVDVFTPSDAGKWKLTATWSGGAGYMQSESTCTFAVNPATEINLLSSTPVTLYWHREEWYCATHYLMDTEMPTSSESATVAFDPSDYWWIGHGHYEFKGTHTGPLSEGILIEKGLWNLSIWAAAREPSQHFLVELSYWDENHEFNSIESWTTEYFSSTSPDVPTQFTHSFDLPAKIIPKGSCLGFEIYDCRDSNVKWFFDSTLHPSHLTIPPSTEVVNYTLNIMSATGGSTNLDLGAHTYLQGTEVTVTAIPQAGYSFDHWILDGANAGTANPISVTMNSNHALQAVFAPSTISLSVVAGTGGTVSPSGIQTLTIGQIYQFSANPNSGYGFDHWDLNGQNKGSSNPLTLTATATMEGQTLTALFTAISSTTPPPGTEGLSLPREVIYAAVAAIIITIVAVAAVILKKRQNRISKAPVPPPPPF
jgi:hypothetical protein